MPGMRLWKWRSVSWSGNFDRLSDFSASTNKAIFDFFSNLKNVWRSSVAFKVRCVSWTRFRVVVVGLSQVVAILLLLEWYVWGRCKSWQVCWIVVGCIPARYRYNTGGNNTVTWLRTSSSCSQVEISRDECSKVERFREKSSHVKIFRKVIPNEDAQGWALASHNFRGFPFSTT